MSIYDISKSYLDNFTSGPFFTGEIPKRPQPTPIDFLGFTLNSPLGVPAGPLLNSKWVAMAGKLGFDLPTYKTIRSFAYLGHPLPNVIFVEKTAEGKAVSSQAPSSLSITNSFGMPSMSPDFLMQDIHKANASLSPGQVLIVSIVGSLNQGLSFQDDFVKTALLAKSAGAKIIEANFSCPNVGKSEGSLYTNPEAVFEFTQKIARAIHPIPLLIKVGSIPDESLLKAILIAAAKGGAKGVCALNSVSMEVTLPTGEPALGPDRKTSGVCGDAIRQEALSFMQAASEINQSEKLGLTLLGCGGLMTPEHLEQMLSSGATIAMSATGMMWDPLLAYKYHQRMGAYAAARR